MAQRFFAGLQPEVTGRNVIPQEFEQPQSASAGQEVGDIVESAGVQVDGTADALDAVLDDIESVLESNAEEYVGSFVQKGGE